MRTQSRTCRWDSVGLGIYVQGYPSMKWYSVHRMRGVDAQLFGQHAMFARRSSGEIGKGNTTQGGQQHS